MNITEIYTPGTTALAGKPNSGKSSLFNALTGLNQKIGNFTGVTVEKATGQVILPSGKSGTLVDLPGTYSLFPKSEDEAVTANILSDCEHYDYPERVLIVADATALKNSLLLCSQIADTGIPCLLIVNRVDLLEKSGKRIDFEKLSQAIGLEIMPVSAHTGFGIGELQHRLGQPFLPAPELFLKDLNTSESSQYKTFDDYKSFLKETSKNLNATTAAFDRAEALMIQDMLARYQRIDQILESVVVQAPSERPKKQAADKLLSHPVWGYVIFMLALAVMFQAIFAWAEKPMEWIELFFSEAGQIIAGLLPEGTAQDLVQNGILAGIGGVVVFVPQIAFLFFFIAVLEESGYMARVVFLMDRIMSRFGLNGRSVIPLIGGMACAIPSIMSARGIPDKKERLITILVTPLMSCSARIPVYTLLISLVIPEYYFWGFINIRGLIMLGLYVLGFLMALLVAAVMHRRLPQTQPLPFILELPQYRFPSLKNIFLTVWHKCIAFIWEAGRVILMISIALWFLVSYGPDTPRAEIESKYEQLSTLEGHNPSELEAQKQAELLEVSYAGYLGKAIEPIIRPLGFDWKIGIGLIASFAAREVFVGTMAALYAATDQEEDPITLKERMRQEIFQDSGKPVYSLATGLALIIFYAFAMQCMSTLAITKRETGSWKWPGIMLAYLTVMAWVGAWVVQVMMG
jgi:ferrous iron transport protein B